jgi:hypothetical protein
MLDCVWQAFSSLLALVTSMPRDIALQSRDAASAFEESAFAIYESTS